MSESEIYPALGFGGCCLLLVIAVVAIVGGAVRRRRRGREQAAERGWEWLPDGTDVLAGWRGWPFARAVEPGGRTKDIVTGVHGGVRFMSLTWSQTESDISAGHGPGGTESERYNIVAVATRQDYPPLAVIRGRELREVLESRFETGDSHFDRRWDLFGDASFGTALLTSEVREEMDGLGHAWVFQPGWITRVTPWAFYGGEDRMLEELEELVAPLRLVPPRVWQAHGGPPDFLTTFTEPGRG